MGVGDVLARLLGRSRPPVVVVEAPVPTAEQIASAVRDVETRIEGRVPAAVTARVHRITGTVEDMVPRLDRFGLGDRQAYTIVATATSYLPEAVDGYLRLPRDFADRRVVSRGKTSLMLLCDQLDLLAMTLEKISDAVYRQDAQALIAHGQFLTEKFGQSSLDVTGPGALPGGAL